MKLSAVIPTLNEAENIERLVRRLLDCGNPDFQEVIVVDAGSTDETRSIAKAAGARVILAENKGRAPQMNEGAAAATGNILYFVHGDSLPPEDYYENIKTAVAAGSQIGGFRFVFDSDKAIFAFNNYITKFNKIFVRGGDQTMYVTRELFDKLGGFRSDFKIMEDYDFIERAQKVTDFKVIQNDVLVSARKYDTNSWARVQIANVIVFSMYRFGASQDRMVNTYKRLLDYR